VTAPLPDPVSGTPAERPAHGRPALARTRALDVAAGSRTLVRALDWTIAAGECWAILGPNGAGKTLLLHTLAGLRPARRGDVLIEGTALRDWSRRLVAQKMALLLQEEASDYWGSVAEYIRLGRLPHGRQDAHGLVRESLAIMGLLERADQPFRWLSGGERQRARIAQTIVQDTALLLWDEPLNHLDLRQRAEVTAMLGVLRQRGKAIVLTAHEPEWAAAHCSHALLLYDSGRTAVGPARSVITDRAIRELYSLDEPTPVLSASGMRASDPPTPLSRSR